MYFKQSENVYITIQLLKKIAKIYIVTKSFNNKMKMKIF